MNATTAIAMALLQGRVLTIKTSFKEFGVTNLPREVSRQIEKKFGVSLSRVRKSGKSKYGVDVTYFEYRLPNTEYNSDGIAKMREYISENSQTETKHTRSGKKIQLDLFK